jgi:hypothetical protein
MQEAGAPSTESLSFMELRRKVQRSELLSMAMESLLRQTRFTGRLSVVVQNGTILKCGYEEGYFSSSRREAPG